MARILTNKYNLPETIVKAVTYDTHKVSGDISVTQLIDAPKIRILKMQNDYTEDVSDMLYALVGTALHHILERANIESVRKRAFIMTAETIMKEAEKFKDSDPDAYKKLTAGANWIFNLIPIFFPEIGNRYIFEVTLRTEMVGFKTVLYGTFDLYDTHTGILEDYKHCSVYNYIYPESRKKWTRQTNTYAYKLRRNGYVVNGIRIIALFRDWSEFGYMRNKHEYPPRNIMTIPIPLWSQDEAEKYILQRLKIHEDAMKGPVPDCTGEERWSVATQYAVKTPGAKRAHRVFDNPTAAQTYIEEREDDKKFKKAYVEVRPGESRFCKGYCPVSEHCEQYKRELEELKKYEQDDQEI